MERPPLPSRSNWPAHNDIVALRHPASDLTFLRLFPSDCDPPVLSTTSISNLQPRYGIHHDTALTACRIASCNEPGFLSTSIDRDSVADRVDDPPGAILLGRLYYYHLRTPKDHELYPSCRDFMSWRFPHHALPNTWIAEPKFGRDLARQSNWTAMSILIKERDKECLVSGWKDGLSTAHVVPKSVRSWVRLPLQCQYITQNTLILVS
jgi:hypothetical protein